MKPKTKWTGFNRYSKRVTRGPKRHTLEKYPALAGERRVVQRTAIPDKASTKSVRQVLIKRGKREPDGLRCHYCACRLTPGTATADHVTPRYRGGMTTKKNIVLACADCNYAKGHMPYDAFLRQRGYKRIK